MQTQLELSLDRAGGIQAPGHRQRRLTRARWWFAQMRRAVEDASEGSSSPASPPQPMNLLKASSRQSA
jgi:hypothetical protein